MAKKILDQVAGMFSKDAEEPKPKESPLNDAAYLKKNKKSIEEEVGYDESKDYGQKIRKFFGLK